MGAVEGPGLGWGQAEASGGDCCRGHAAVRGDRSPVVSDQTFDELAVVGGGQGDKGLCFSSEPFVLQWGQLVETEGLVIVEVQSPESFRCTENFAGNQQPVGIAVDASEQLVRTHGGSGWRRDLKRSAQGTLDHPAEFIGREAVIGGRRVKVLPGPGQCAKPCCDFPQPFDPGDFCPTQLTVTRAVERTEELVDVALSESGDAAVADPDLETDHDRMIGSEENEVKTVEMSVAGLTGWTRGFLLSSNGRDRDQADHGQDDRGDMAPVALDERRHQPISPGQHERQKWPGTLPPQSVAKS